MKIGDIVRLKGGPELMTVITTSDQDIVLAGSVRTAWHTSDGEPRREIYPIEALEVCKP